MFLVLQFSSKTRKSKVLDFHGAQRFEQFSHGKINVIIHVITTCQQLIITVCMYYIHFEVFIFNFFPSVYLNLFCFLVLYNIFIFFCDYA